MYLGISVFDLNYHLLQVTRQTIRNKSFQHSSSLSILYYPQIFLSDLQQFTYVCVVTNQTSRAFYSSLTCE